MRSDGIDGCESSDAGYVTPPTVCGRAPYEPVFEIIDASPQSACERIDARIHASSFAYVAALSGRARCSHVI